jgi:hypothetical protein
MPQIFRRRSNTIARVSILGSVVFLVVGGWALDAVWWSPYTTKVNVPIEQPVPFSHEHHYSGLGIDCRYCHTSVEKSSFAGIPPTETCMTLYRCPLVGAGPAKPGLRRAIALEPGR